MKKKNKTGSTGTTKPTDSGKKEKVAQLAAEAAVKEALKKIKDSNKEGQGAEWRDE